MLKRQADWGHSTCIIHNAGGFAPSAVFDATTLTTGSGGTNEVQTITITGTPTGGTFTQAFRGATSGAIAYNAIADAVETALEAMVTIGVGNVRVTGGPGPGTPYVVTFVNALGHADQPLMTSDGDSLTGGTTPDAATAQTTAGSATGWDPRILVGSYDKPGTVVIEVVDPRGDGLDKIREYVGSGTIYGIVDGIEEFLGTTAEADRSMPVWGKQAGLVVDARKIKNYSTYKSAIDTWAAANGVTVRHG